MNRVQRLREHLLCGNGCQREQGNKREPAFTRHSPALLSTARRTAPPSLRPSLEVAVISPASQTRKQLSLPTYRTKQLMPHLQCYLNLCRALECPSRRRKGTSWSCPTQTPAITGVQSPGATHPFSQPACGTCPNAPTCERVLRPGRA